MSERSVQRLLESSQRERMVTRSRWSEVTGSRGGIPGVYIFEDKPIAEVLDALYI